MAQRTPAPWIVTAGYTRGAQRVPATVSHGNGAVAACFDNATAGSGEANARLIASAPDLLAFVERIANPPAGSTSHGEAALRLLVLVQDARALLASARLS